MRGFSFVGIIIMIGVIVLLEYYTYTSIRFLLRNSRANYKTIYTILYFVLSLLWISTLLTMPMWRNWDEQKMLRNILVSFGMGMLIAKLLISAVLILDDLRRFLFYVSSLFFAQNTEPKLVQQGMTRSEFMNSIALLLGGGLFATLLLGLKNKYNYKWKEISLSFDHLPHAFKGMKIVQISDIHSGSLDDIEAVSKGIDLIMQKKPDLILFTGDLVNNRHEEALQFVSSFSKLKAPLGVYSILGNHDYGDYIPWDTEQAKQDNLEKLKKLHADMGWRLLLDEHIVLEKENESIALLGVQNTSFGRRFHSYGDLSKAYQGSEHVPFKILMSHDPSHWDGEVNTKYKDIALTLSGHTHGMQFGVEIPGFKWSPVKYIYKQWAGLYENNKQYLYVNRGFGFLGYPGRVGIMPELTCIELS
ncbi:MAG: metallophosphoesterase [Chitinophagaceae bacterium]